VSPEASLPVQVQAKKAAKQVTDDILIRKFVQKWEGKFWPKFWEQYASNQLRCASATQVQRIIRGYLGRRRFEKEYARALEELDAFWEMKRRNRLWEKEKKRIERETRAKVQIYFLPY
jgi:AAA+ ATPase superfamily predicted ATPase